MCGKNVVANSCYLPWRYYPVATTATNIDKTARTAHEMAEAQRDSFEAIAKNFAAAQRRSIGLAEAAEVVREQGENNARTAEAFVRGVSRQQEGMRALTQGWVGAYRDFFYPFAYMQEGMRTFQRAARQGLEVTEQVARQGLRTSEQATRQGLKVAEEATEQTEDILRQTEKVTREAELRTAVMGALRTANYDELSVAEVSRRIEGLPTEQLRKVR